MLCLCCHNYPCYVTDVGSIFILRPNLSVPILHISDIFKCQTIALHVIYRYPIRSKHHIMRNGGLPVFYSRQGFTVLVSGKKVGINEHSFSLQDDFILSFWF
ncbi:hypothetical protein ACJX0J_022101, partial [Zea mays]